MADRIPDSLIDDILESTKKYSSDVELSSMDDIDTILLSLGIDGSNEKKEESEKDFKSKIVTDSKKNNVEIESQFAETAQKIEEPVLDTEEQKSSFLDLIKNSNKFSEGSDGASDESENIPSDDENESENVTVYSRTDGQMELQVDGEEISTEEEAIEQEPEPEKTVPSVSGQISIEKTRMFNDQTEKFNLS